MCGQPPSSGTGWLARMTGAEGFTSRTDERLDLLLSQSGGFGEVDPEALPPTLVAPRGVGRAMAELALHESLLDIRGRREAGSQRVPAKGKPPLPLRQVTPDP